MKSMGKTRKRLWLVLVVVLVATLSGGGVALADGHVSVRVEFDESQGQLPEGVAIDKRGNIFVGLAPLGQLLKVAPGSDEPEVFGQISGINPASDLGLLGLATDARGNVYAGVQSANVAVNGVWVFDGQTGEAVRIPGSEAIGLANDVAFDNRGNLYITDSAQGAIWRVPKHGELEPWLEGDPHLAGTGGLGLGVPIGANGIEFHHGVLYIAVTEQFSLVAVPVSPSGAPGSSEVIANFPGGVFPGAPDGLAIDAHGDIYVALIAQQTIAKVDGDGNITMVAAGDPLDWPSSIAFGTSRGEQKTLFAVNFSIGEGFGDPVVRSGPSLVEIAVGVPGSPLP
jgi:sugar lactone lactonase YvrE